MKPSILAIIPASLSKANQWFTGTPERALDQAYRAALMIKDLEDKHFDGKKISLDSKKHGSSLMSYFKTELNKHLNTVKVRLAEFNISRFIMDISEQALIQKRINDGNSPEQYLTYDVNQYTSNIIEKLNSIDKIVQKYTFKENSVSQIVVSKSDIKLENNRGEPQPIVSPGNYIENNNSVAQDTLSDKTGILPRSILGTINRIQQNLDPKAEQEIVKNFRRSKNRTIISIRFILLLIIVPLLTQQLTKNFIISPIVDSRSENLIFLNTDLKKEALVELEEFEKELEFNSIIFSAPQISAEEKEEKLKDKAVEIKEQYHHKSADAIKNIAADSLSLLAFAAVIFFSKKDIEVLKSFIDDVVYGLSDSAKAFIIILFTDVFVGYHSPHGWEVLLEGLSQHLGIVENREFIYLFIATFPVILDTMIKYWIFRYLNRISPSAVATYRNMNE